VARHLERPADPLAADPDVEPKIFTDLTEGHSYLVF
jgi:hypothetical protein